VLDSQALAAAVKVGRTLMVATGAASLAARVSIELQARLGTVRIFAASSAISKRFNMCNVQLLAAGNARMAMRRKRWATVLAVEPQAGSGVMNSTLVMAFTSSLARTKNHATNDQASLPCQRMHATP
jgi:hypothetical protein